LIHETFPFSFCRIPTPTVDLGPCALKSSGLIQSRSSSTTCFFVLTFFSDSVPACGPFRVSPCCFCFLQFPPFHRGRRLPLRWGNPFLSLLYFFSLLRSLFFPFVFFLVGHDVRLPCFRYPGPRGPRTPFASLGKVSARLTGSLPPCFAFSFVTVLFGPTVSFFFWGRFPFWRLFGLASDTPAGLVFSFFSFAMFFGGLCCVHL